MYPFLIFISGQVSLHQQYLNIVAGLRLAQGGNTCYHDHVGWFELGDCGLVRQPIISPTSNNTVCPEFDKKCLNNNINFLLVT